MPLEPAPKTTIRGALGGGVGAGSDERRVRWWVPWVGSVDDD